MLGILPFCHSIRSDNFLARDHPCKTLACLRGEGCPLVPMVKRSQYVRIKNPPHKHFAGMPMVGRVGVKNCKNLPTSLMDGPQRDCFDIHQCPVLRVLPNKCMTFK